MLQPNIQSFIIFLLIYSTGSIVCQSQNSESSIEKLFSVEVTNPTAHSRAEVKVLIGEENLRKSLPDFNPEAFVVFKGDEELPSQYVKDGEAGIVVILEKLEGNASVELSVRYKESGIIKNNYTKRTQAEISHKTGGSFKDRKYVGGKFVNVNKLKVPEEHTDHSYYIRYEGPGWESDKVGYRFYLDWRNAIDVFGKTTHEVVLQKVGQDGFDSYHDMQPWGMDVLKVGKSLGLGSIATFENGNAIRIDKTDSVYTEISENGALLSSITTQYYGWKVGGKKYNVQSHLSIHGGSRLTRHWVKADGDPENLCTGIRKEPDTNLYQEKGNDNQWGYLATYGKQSLNSDMLGLAVLFKPNQFHQFTEDEHSHIVTLTPASGSIEYYFLAAWELEKEGIKNEQEFLDYLKKTANELANPIEVKILAPLVKAKN